jgi:hypothetical protein
MAAYNYVANPMQAIPKARNNNNISGYKWASKFRIII